MADTGSKLADNKGPRPLGYRPRSPGYALGIRRGPHWYSKDRLLHTLRTLAWVAPLTLLIWIYAERQQERRQTVRFPVQVSIASPDRVILGSRERFVTAELRGPAAEVEAVKNKLLQGGDEAAIALPLDQNLSPGSHEIRTALIAGDALFRTHAITVDNTEPQLLSVYIDQMVERDVPIAVPASVTNLDGKPVFEPARVKVRGPKSVLDRAEADGLLHAFADLSGLQSLKTPGVHEEKAVPVVTQVRGEHVQVTPTAVNATFKVRPADVTVTWSFMPVWVNTPPGFGDRYRVVLTNQTLKDVRLVGPAETIAAMQQENFRPKPKARIDVSNADLPAGQTRSKVVQFDDLPKGVAVSPDDAQRTAEFRIVEPGKE